jgi:hypothetical protein
VSIGAGCSTTSAVANVTVNPLPAATATAAGPVTFCQGGTVTLNANTATGFSYQWLINGLGVNGATGSSYTANTGGNYAIRITDGNGCQNTSSVIGVTVNPLPVPSVTAAGSTTICQGSSVTLNANTGSGLSYQWNRNSSPISGATNATYSATTAGSYTVTETGAGSCSATSSAISVTVNPAPAATIAPTGNQSLCQGSSLVLNANTGTGLSYQWQSGATNISGATNASYSATTAGTYTVVVTSNGCSAASAGVTISVTPLPTASFSASGPLSICADDSTTFTANNGTGLSYQWMLGGNPITGATNIAYTAHLGGSYTVVVTNSNNCSQTSAVTVLTVNPVPTASLTYTTPLTFCEGGAVILSATTGANLYYQWMQNGTPVQSGVNSDYIAYQSGSYNVKVSTGFGCSVVSQPVHVTVNPLPQPVITRTNSLLSTGTFASYQWLLNGVPIPGGNSQSIVINQNGGYTVTVTDNNGCQNTSAVMFVNNLGIKATGIQYEVKVYPNPASRVVYIDAPVNVQVAVRDIAGRTLIEKENAKQLDLGDLADGVYMIFVSDTQGRLLKTEKLFKSE